MNIYKTPLFKYIAGDSLVGKSVSMTIDHVALEEVEGQGGKKEEKLVLYFAESKKGMILNKTNAKRIGKLFGPETDEWKDSVVELYTEPVKAFGETHNALRVRESKVVKAIKKIKAESAQMSPEEKAERLNGNRETLHGPEDSAIGETDKERFAKEVINRTPFYASESQIWMTLARLGLEYDPDNEEMLFNELATDAGKQADLSQA